MHANILSIIAISVLLVASSWALPTDLEGQAGEDLDKRKVPHSKWHCTYPQSYTITSQKPVWIKPELITGVTVQGPGSITAGYSYAKGISWSVSANVGLKMGDIFSVGLSVGWGIAKYSGTSLSATVTCPDNVSCGLTAQPLMLEVKGLYTAYLCGSQFSADKTYPCTNFAPPWCPRTVFNATIGQSYAYTALIPLTAPRSTVAEQDLKAVAYAACTVGDGAPGLDPCPNLGIGPTTPTVEQAPDDPSQWTNS